MFIIVFILVSDRPSWLLFFPARFTSFHTRTFLLHYSSVSSVSPFPTAILNGILFFSWNEMIGMVEESPAKNEL